MSLPENPHALDDSVVEGLLRGTPMALEPALTAFVADVRRLQQAPVPAPSAALASLLTDGFAAPDAAVSPQPARGRWRRRIAGVAGVCVAASATLVSAAAAQALPHTAQHVVAGIVDSVTPFTVPDPPARLRAPRVKQHLVVKVPSTIRPVPTAPAVASAGPRPTSPPPATTPPAKSSAPPVHPVVPPVPARPTGRGHDDGTKVEPTPGDGHHAHEPLPHAVRPTEPPEGQHGKGSGDGRSHGKGADGGTDDKGSGRQHGDG